MIQRLKKYYFDTVIPKLMSTSDLNYKNKQQVPRVKKIVINRGLGDASQNEQILNSSQRIYLKNFIDYFLFVKKIKN